MSNRRQFLESIGSGMLGAAAAQLLSAASQPRLNFVFLLIDDMGWRDLSCFGSRFFETPNIDKLASQGMKFTNAYAAAPLCSPTRASILTGKYPARLHLTAALPASRKPGPSDRWITPTMEPALPLKEVTLAEALKPAGYVSAAIGKWHLGGEGFYPQDQGFDVNVGGTHIGMVTNHFYPEWKVSRQAGPYPVGGVPIEGKPGEYLTDRLTDAALEFIETNRARPFFLYLAHYAVHIPIQAKQEIIRKYEQKARPDDPQHNPIYAAMVQSVDESVGRVLAKLDALDLANNTVVFLMSDNGGVVGPQPPNQIPPTSNSPLRAGKATLYEGGIREPMIVRWPGIVKPDTICDVPVISNDFFPTIMAMAGLESHAHTGVDGANLVPLLQQRGKLKRNALYWHFPHYALPGASPGAAIREGNYKLIEVWEEDRVELYDLAKDLGEDHDLSGQMPARAERMRKRLHEWQKSVNAQMPVPNPRYHPRAAN